MLILTSWNEVAHCAACHELVLGESSPYRPLDTKKPALCAAAHVGGVAALVLSTGVKDPKAVRESLLSTARKVKDKNLYGAGIVQVDGAVDKALKRHKEEDPGLGLGLSLGLILLTLGWLRVRRHT